MPEFIEIRIINRVCIKFAGKLGAKIYHRSIIVFPTRTITTTTTKNTEGSTNLNACRDMFSIIFVQAKPPAFRRSCHKDSGQAKQANENSDHSFGSTRNYHSHDKIAFSLVLVVVGFGTCFGMYLDRYVSNYPCLDFITNLICVINS